MPCRVIGLGAGGHAKVVIDILRRDESIELVGLLDPRADLRGRFVLGVPVIGDDDDLPGLRADGVRHAFLGVGGLADPPLRTRLFERLGSAGFDVVDAVHPRATPSPTCRWGRGVTIMANAVVQADADLGDNVLVNTAAVIEHDCRVGDHCLIGPGAILAGGVTVEAGALIGMGARIREGVRVGRRARVGAAALVLRDVPDDATVFGVPAR